MNNLKRKLYVKPIIDDNKYDIYFYIIYNNCELRLNKSLIKNIKGSPNILRDEKFNYSINLNNKKITLDVTKDVDYLLRILRYIKYYNSQNKENLKLLHKAILGYAKELKLNKIEINNLLKYYFKFNVDDIETKLKSINNNIKNLLDKYKELKEDVNIVKDDETGLYTISYKNNGVNFQNELVRYARGLTIDSTGKIIIRGFEKFFNYKQLEYVNEEAMSKEFKSKYSLLDGIGLDDKLEVYEKLDGSLILLSSYNGKLITSTTSSINNDYSKKALEYFNNKNNALNGALLEYLIKNNKTLAFEYISPENQIVIKYKDMDYVLLGCIDNDSGLELSLKGLRQLSNKFNFTLFKVYYLSIRELINEQKNNKSIEGYIVKNKYNKRLKFKVDSWFEFSNTISIFYGSKLTKNKVITIIEKYIEDDIDDLISYESQHEVHKKYKIVSTINDELNDLENKSNDLYHQLLSNNISKKELGQMEGIEKSLVFNKLKTNNFIDNKTKPLITKYLLEKLS